MTIFDLAEAYSTTGRPGKALPLTREFLQKTAKLGSRLPAKIQRVIPRAKRLLGSLSPGGAMP